MIKNTTNFKISKVYKNLQRNGIIRLYTNEIALKFT